MHLLSLDSFPKSLRQWPLYRELIFTNDFTKKNRNALEKGKKERLKGQSKVAKLSLLLLWVNEVRVMLGTLWEAMQNALQNCPYGTWERQLFIHWLLAYIESSPYTTHLCMLENNRTGVEKDRNNKWETEQQKHEADGLHLYTAGCHIIEKKGRTTVGKPGHVGAPIPTLMRVYSCMCYSQSILNISKLYFVLIFRYK